MKEKELKKDYLLGWLKAPVTTLAERMDLMMVWSSEEMRYLAVMMAVARKMEHH